MTPLTEPRPSDEPTIDRIAALLRGITGFPIEISPDHHLRDDLAMTGMEEIELTFALEEEFGFEITTPVGACDTVADLVAMMDRLTADAENQP